MRTVTPTETQTQVAPTGGPQPDGGQRGESRLRRAWGRGWAYTRENPMLVGFIVVGLIARIVFWAVTDRRIDDALITIKFDKNVADGVGLVHNLGDGHVQGFTSALSVLVPLPGELIAHGGGLFLIRLVSLVAFALAAALRLSDRAELGLGALADRLRARLPGPRPKPGLLRRRRDGDPDRGRRAPRGRLLRAGRGLRRRAASPSDWPLLARPDFVLWVAPAYVVPDHPERRRALRAGAISAASWSRRG